MFAIAMALMTCVGTWVAMRRHPLYAGHAAFRMIGATLLLVAGGSCVVVLAVWLTMTRSALVQFTAVIIAVILVTLGLIFGITAVTAPPSVRLDSQLPLNVIPVKLHRRPLQRWWRAALIFFSLCTLLALIPGPVRYIVASLALVAGILAAVMIPVAYVTARRLDRAVTALELHPWLHWHYSAEAKAAWIGAQLERLRAAPPLKRAWRTVVWVCLAVVAATMLFCDGPLLFRAVCGLGCCLLIIGLLEAAVIEVRRAPRKLEKRMWAAAPDAYFGHDGVVCDDRFLIWLDANQYLTHAILDERTPRSIAFEFEKIVPGAYAGPQTVTLRQDVLIPATANSADLRLLQCALRTRCPSAQVHLVP